jgi:hypothetical protein
MFFRTGGIPWESALLAQHLLRQPDRAARVLPQGRARLEIIADTAVSIGGTTQRLRLAMIHGQNSIPSGVWIDERGDYVASDVQWFMAVRPGIEAALPVLRAIELAWRNTSCRIDRAAPDEARHRPHRDPEWRRVRFRARRHDAADDGRDSW